MNLFKENLKEEDRVYCVFNHAIEGRITKKTNFHGMYLYTIKLDADDARNFEKFIGLSPENVKFLHYQLRKIYKTEVKKKCQKTKKQILKKKSLKKKKS